MANLDDDLDEMLLEKPCRFCHDLYPEIVLLDHQAICQALIEQVSYGADIERRTPANVAGLNQTITLASDDDDEELYREIACKICGQFYPTLVMLEHQAICEVLHLAAEEQFRASEEIQRRNSAAEESERSSSNVPFVEATKEKQKEEVKPQNAIESEGSTLKRSVIEEISKLAETVKVTETKMEPKREANLLQTKGDNPTHSSRNEKQKSNSEKNATTRTVKTFLSLANDTEISKDSENKKPNSSEFPQNPLFEYADQDDDEDQNITDDDCEETLEDFWQRAREQLRCQRAQNV